MERHFQYVGGKEQLNSLRSLRIDSELKAEANKGTATCSLLWIKPDQLRVTCLIKDSPFFTGEMKEIQAIQGNKGWSASYGFFGGFMLTDEDVVLRDAHFLYHDPLLIRFYQFDSVATKSQTDFDGAACYQVELRKHPQAPSVLFFDKKEGHLRGVRIRWTMPTGVLRVETRTFREYKPFAQLNTATVITLKSIFHEKNKEPEEEKENVVRIRKVTVNDVNEKDLAVPVEIQDKLRNAPKTPAPLKK